MHADTVPWGSITLGIVEPSEAAYKCACVSQDVSGNRSRAQGRVARGDDSPGMGMIFLAKPFSTSIYIKKYRPTVHPIR